MPIFFKERKEFITIDGGIGGEKVVLHSSRIVMLEGTEEIKIEWLKEVCEVTIHHNFVFVTELDKSGVI